MNKLIEKNKYIFKEISHYNLHNYKDRVHVYYIPLILYNVTIKKLSLKGKRDGKIQKDG